MATANLSVGIRKDGITLDIGVGVVIVMPPADARWLAQMLALRADQLDPPPGGDDDTDEEEVQ